MLLPHFSWYASHPGTIKFFLGYQDNQLVMDKMNDIQLIAYGELARAHAITCITHPQYIRPPQANGEFSMHLFLAELAQGVDYLLHGGE